MKHRAEKHRNRRRPSWRFPGMPRNIRWMPPHQWQPPSTSIQAATLDLRLVKVRTASPGFRTQELQIVTTLRDTQAHSAAQIAAWYQQRWQVELYFDDIKTSLHMHAFRCKSPHMLVCELLMHMIAYNLVRHLMMSAETMRDLHARGTLSFKGTMDRLDQWQWAIWSAPNSKQARQRREALLQT